MTDPGKRARAIALEELRHRHLDDLEIIYQSQLAIVTSAKAEDRDKVNAAKVLTTILGVGRPGPEKQPEAPKEAPAPAQQVAPLRQELLDSIDEKLGVK